MIKTYSSWTLAVAAAVGICALAGCNQRESAKETSKDVAEERQDARRTWRKSSREAAEWRPEGAEDRAAAEYDVAVAQADGQRKVAKEKCETMGSDSQKACKDQAEADYESAKAQAQATLDAAKRSGSAEPAPATDEVRTHRRAQSRQGDAHLRDLQSRDCAAPRPAIANYFRRAGCW